MNTFNKYLFYSFFFCLASVPGQPFQASLFALPLPLLRKLQSSMRSELSVLQAGHPSGLSHSSESSSSFKDIGNYLFSWPPFNTTVTVPLVIIKATPLSSASQLSKESFGPKNTLFCLRAGGSSSACRVWVVRAAGLGASVRGAWAYPDSASSRQTQPVQKRFEERAKLCLARFS